MMRKFKHSTLGWIAEEKTNGDYRIYKQEKWLQKDIMDFVHCNLFVDSQDREEVIEDDWISNAWKEYEEYWTTNRYEEFRGIIEKYAPKQVKFFEQDVTNYLRELNYHSRDVIFQTILGFLKQHNLLAEESIVWEWSIPCQHENTWEVYTSNPPQYKCKKCWAFYKN